MLLLLAKRPHSAAFREAVTMLVPGGDWATQMIDPDNTKLKYCIANNTDTHDRLEGSQVRFAGGQVHGLSECLPSGFRAARA